MEKAGDAPGETYLPRFLAPTASLLGCWGALPSPAGRFPPLRFPCTACNTAPSDFSSTGAAGKLAWIRTSHGHTPAASLAW